MPTRFISCAPIQSVQSRFHLLALRRERVSLISRMSAGMLRHLLLRTRFRRHQARYTVVNRELPVVFSRMLNETVCHVGHADLLVAVGIRYQVGHAPITFCLDGRRSVRK